MALVQEEGTARIFDIAPLRFTQYRRERIYHQVLEDQAAIAAAVDATRRASSDSNSVNSLVRLLGITQPATIKETADAERDPALQLILAEMSTLRRELRAVTRPKAQTALEVQRATVAHGPDELRMIQVVGLEPHSREADSFFDALRELGGSRVSAAISNPSGPEPQVIVQFEPAVSRIVLPGLVRAAARVAGLESVSWTTA